MRNRVTPYQSVLQDVDHFNHASGTSLLMCTNESCWMLKLSCLLLHWCQMVMHAALHTILLVTQLL